MHTQTLIDHSPIPVIATEGAEHRVTYANSAFSRVVRRPREELVGRRFSEIVPECAESGTLEALDRVYRTGTAETVREHFEFHGTDVPEFWRYTIWAVLDDVSYPPGLVIQMAEGAPALVEHERTRAISEALMLFAVKLHELRSEENRSAELALRETDHRTKNSLQTIASLLGAEIKRSPESVPSSAVSKILLHAHTLAGMHELLMRGAPRGAPPEEVRASELLGKLSRLWKQIAGPERSLTWDADEISMPMTKSLALATIANELVCNSLKRGAEHLNVRLTSRAKRVSLVESDDGPGFPADFDPAAAGGAGLRFMEAICRAELRGTISYRNRPGGGAEVEVDFALPASDEQPVRRAEPRSPPSRPA